MKATTLPSLLSYFFFYLSISCCVQSKDEPAGYGYDLHSVKLDQAGGSLTADLKLIQNSSVFGADIQNLTLYARFETNYRLQVRVTDSKYKRYEVPQTIIPRETPAATTTSLHGPATAPDTQVLTAEGSDLVFTLHATSPASFTITRRSTGDILFDTLGNWPGIVFKDRYLEITSNLPGNRASIYGLGEQTRPTFRLLPHQTLTLWNADIPASKVGQNLYGSHPFYMDVRSSSPNVKYQAGVTHGVLLLNSNGMDVLYSGDNITYRVIGGMFDFYFFAGPTPEIVVEQYTEFIGRPAPMPLWSFGFHQCRWGYRNISDVEGVLSGYQKSGIPLEALWTDMDYMDGRKDFTFDPINFPEDKVRNLIDRLHKNGQRYVTMLNPGISVNQTYPTFFRGMKDGIFLQWNRTNYQGEAWPGKVYFPDFLNPHATRFWARELGIFRRIIAFDGIWLNMNEISNSIDPTPLNYLDDPPYKINNAGVQRPISDKTVPVSSVHCGNVNEYDVHNLNGLFESRITHAALARITGKRPFVLSRSTFVGSGKYAAHWTGDNAATWEDLGYSIPTILNFGLFGIPMVGADICGFSGHTTEELCRRWIQLGAFYPFSRNHASYNSTAQELYNWPSVAESAKKVLGLRYRLLPYLYTAMYEAHTKGIPIARPLFFTFPEDTQTYGINTQFLIGKGVMVSPVLQPGETSINAYFPAGKWFNLFNYSLAVNTTSGKYMSVDAPDDTINVHVRGGTILIMQAEANRIQSAQHSGYELLVVIDESGNATGEVFLDDGEVLEMGVNETEFSLLRFTSRIEDDAAVVDSQVVNGSYAQDHQLVMNKVVFLGLNPVSNPTSSTLFLNGRKLSENEGVRTSYGRRGRFGIAEIQGLSHLIGKDFELKFKFSS